MYKYGTSVWSINQKRENNTHKILNTRTLKRAGHSDGRAALQQDRQLSRSGMARSSCLTMPQGHPFRCHDWSTNVSPTTVAPQAEHKRRGVETGCERFGCTSLGYQGDKADCRSFDWLPDFGELRPCDSRTRRASHWDLSLPIAACPRPSFSSTNN